MSFVRYYIRDAEGKARQVSKWLADKDANTGCTSIGSKPVLKEKNKIMAGVNFGARSQTEVLVTEFWTDVSIPFITENGRHSTVSRYTQLWEKLLKPYFTGKTLVDYQTHQAASS